MGRQRRPAAAKKKKQKPPPPPEAAIAASSLSPSSLSSLISLTASAAALSRGFLSGHDLDLLPSQTLTLDSLLPSLSLSISRLLSLSPVLAPLPPTPAPTPSWFHRFLSSTPSADHRRWTDAFRMSGTSFYHLLQALAPSLQASPSLPVPADHKLAAALFRLAHAAPFHVIALRFGLPSPQLACRAFYETLRAVTSRLAHLFDLPNGLPRVLQGFNSISLPNCCGLLAFTRFPLASSFITAQALVDSDGRFLNISVGWPGTITPADVFTKSKLYKDHSADLSSGPPVELNNGSVNRYILGDTCCPLLSWLLTPFPADADSSNAAIFNAAHKRGMQLAQQAFGSVLARWRLLRTTWTEECAEAFPHVVVAGCMLHNYLMKCREPGPDKGEVSVAVSEFPDFKGEMDEDGVRAREVVASHLNAVIEERRQRASQSHPS